MGVSAMVTIGAALRLKGFVHRHHGHVHGAQHVGQHMVGFDFEVVCLQLYRDMPVTQMVGRAGQVKRAAMLRAGGDAQHGLWGGLDQDQRAVFGDQNIAPADHGAAWQKNAQTSSLAVGRIKSAFLAHIPIEGDGAGTLHQHAGQATAMWHEFGTVKHQNKK
jgi:hypothetical protein